MSTDLKRIVEAVLFAAETPLSLAQICQVLETKDKAPIELALAELRKEYDFLDRAFDLVEVAGGWRLRTRPEMAFWLRKLKRQSTTRLSRASLETLAIIAYKQPVLKAEIERIRGVEVSGVLRMLMEKDLVRVVGRKDLPGRPLIYGTTKRFLEVFDLRDLSDLPTLEEMQELLGEPDVVREEEQEDAPLFTRGMAGQDDDSDKDGEDDYEGEYDEDGEEEESGIDGYNASDDTLASAGPGLEDEELAAGEAIIQEQESEQMQAAESENKDVQPTEPAPVEVESQTEESIVAPAPEQIEPEPVYDRTRPEQVEQEPGPVYEQPEYQPRDEAEPMADESPAEPIAKPVEQSTAEKTHDLPQEQATESFDQHIPRIEPKYEPEDPSGEGGTGGDTGGDSGPRAA